MERPTGRHTFKQGDQVVYEWEQTLEEVILYFKPPQWALPKYQKELKKQLRPGQQLPQLYVNIGSNSIEVGVKPNPPFLSEELGGQVVKSESYWMIEDEELVVNLQKMRKAETWSCACKRHGELDPLAQNEAKKKIMLERFQEENPGFDFSNAEFNGMIPDPRNFMGGVSYNR